MIARVLTRFVAVCLLLTPFVLPAAEWTRLFDGSNLDHWTLRQSEGWKIADGQLVPNEIRKDNYAWTKEKYGDFVLEAEFRLTKDCNSGVFFRTDPENPVQGGFEIQVFDSHGKMELGSHDCGALYDAVPPKVNAARPAGEWNTLRLTVKGPKVKVELNGQTVVEANLDDWTDAQKNPDGSKNKFKTALKDLPRTGHIGLQYHGHEVGFRNIRVQPL